MVAESADGPGAPHGLVFALVVGLMVAGQILLSDPAEAIAEAISEAISKAISEAISQTMGPAGRLLLPVALLISIQFLSSGRGAAVSEFFNTGKPESIHQVGGSPFGVALVLLVVADGPGAPHGLVFALVVGLMVAGQILLSDPGEAISEAISEIKGPAGLLLLPVALLIFIQFLSSGRGAAVSAFFNTGEPESIHRVGGSPFGVALFLLVLLFLLYNRVSLFGSGDDDSGE